MVTPDFIMNFLGIVFLIGSAYLVLSLIFRKHIWNYPVIASMYIASAMLLAFFGIALIKQIYLSYRILAFMGIAMLVWGFITSKLPAKRGEKEEKVETNKGT